MFDIYIYKIGHTDNSHLLHHTGIYIFLTVTLTQQGKKNS